MSEKEPQNPIIEEEERVLRRVKRTLAEREAPRGRATGIDYDAELLNLRDQILEARSEDIPPLIEEMERMQEVARRRAKVTEGNVDARSPYFGRMVIEENDKKREVLIGRSTFLDPRTGVRIVDWRDAPVSRIYYRYEEGDAYDEEFGDREVEGEVLIKRSLTIQGGTLRRIKSPQGSFVKTRDGGWHEVSAHAFALEGGQGAAMRPKDFHAPGKLGVGEGDGREDKHLAEITALIDKRQFQLISKPTSGLVVVQGGAGSGKTTIGLHRLAYLAFQDPKAFRPDRMLVVVFNDALVRYIKHVLPALGVEGVSVVTYEDWARKLRRHLFPELPKSVAEDTPTVVVRFKKHPALLRLIESEVARRTKLVVDEIIEVAKTRELGGKVLRALESTEGHPLTQRLQALETYLRSDEAKGIPIETRHAVARIGERVKLVLEDVPSLWAEILTDRALVRAAFQEHAPGHFTERELEWALAHCGRRCSAALAHREALGDVPEPVEGESEDRPVDGVEEEDEHAALDVEDDALLLRLHQLVIGPLTRGGAPLTYEHVFVDETQDLSPTELKVVLDTTTERRSITLAGDVAQRLHMENGFTDWRSVLAELGLDHVSIEPLRLSYRSTQEIIDFASHVLGPLEQEDSREAVRRGVAVEHFNFSESGEAVAFVSEALRNLVNAERFASVAVIARYPEQADLWYEGLVRGEVPNLSRVAFQDFSFRPGVEVTDVTQVKGLEFDYVVIVEAGAASFPVDDESRHLLHIAATRAAHQLWIVSSGAASALLPSEMREL
jgi:DNA helicase II / ATP-dependent DNA helicase PcrA